MKLSRAGVLLAFGPPAIAILGYVFQAPWLFLGVTVAWLLMLQALDAVAGHERGVPWSALRNEIRPPSSRFPTEDVILYMYVVVHLAAVALGAWQLSRTEDVLPWMLFAFPVALSGATLLIVAHELLHGSTRLDRWFGRAAGAVTFWGVHEYEHLFLHHRDESFCTDRDPAAARLGQTYYSYLARSVGANYRDAWELQSEVLRARGERGVGAKVLATIYLPPVVVAAVVTILFGGWGLAFFLVQALLTVALFLLGTYNQHYGLVRRVGADGRYEPYTYMNVWSADQRVTNLAYWAVGRHAHHHLDPFRSYTELAVIEGSPLLPHGYNTTLMLSLVPPLWFRVMNPRVADVFARRDRLPVTTPPSSDPATAPDDPVPQRRGRRRARRSDALVGASDAQLLDQTGLFSGLDPGRRDDVFGRARRVSCRSGASIVEEGEVGDAFYAIADGALRVTSVDADGREIVLARLERGEYFGEQALIDEVPSRRNATVTAIDDAELLRLDQADFRYAVAAGSKAEATMRDRGAKQLVEKWTRQRPAFGSIDQKLVESLSHNIREFAPGTRIFSQGDVADGVYFIVDGEVRIDIAGSGEHPRETVLVAGQMFGEVASLASTRRGGGAVAVTEIRTLFFDKKQFRKLYDTRPELAGWVQAARSLYDVPNRGAVSIHEGEYRGAGCVTSVFRLDDGRTVRASKMRGDEVFVLVEEDAPEGRVVSWTQGPDRRELTLVDGRITAIVCDGYWADLEAACAFALDGTPLDGWREALFRDSGRIEIAEPQESTDPRDLLCNCMRVTRGRIRDVIGAGSTEVDAVADTTGAGTVCGGCRPKISAMLGNTCWEPVRVVEWVDRGPGVRSYRLAPYGGPVEPYEPGQHVVVQSLIDERFVARTYTLTSSPASDSYEITVKREPMGYFSGWLFERAGEDPFIRIAPPSGTGIHTMLGDAPLVCLVAGIGVTPAFALARHLDAVDATQRLHIDYSARTPSDLVYADELRAIASRRPNVSVDCRVSSQHGRLQADDVERLVGDYPVARFFVCGPLPYHDVVTGALRAAGVAAERICSEEFRHATDGPRAPIASAS